MSRKSRIIATWLIVLSAMFQVFMALVESGRHATPFGTLDANSMPFGFGDPVTWNHMAIILSRATFHGAWQYMGLISLGSLVSHLVGLILVWRPVSWRGVRLAFFAAQTILFPTAWVGLLLWAVMPFAGAFDGEAIDDGPFNAVCAPASWLVTSLLALVLEWRDNRHAAPRQLDTSDPTFSISP